MNSHKTINYRYALPCGEEGSLLSLPKPLYIASIDTVANRMAVLDRESKPHILSVTTAEYRFKAAVVAGREQEAVEVVFQLLRCIALQLCRWPKQANFWDRGFSNSWPVLESLNLLSPSYRTLCPGALKSNS